MSRGLKPPGPARPRSKSVAAAQTRMAANVFLTLTQHTTGSGTTGKLARWTGSTALGDGPVLASGRATLSAGVATVTTAAITDTARVLLAHEGTGTVANFGHLFKANVDAGTSFEIHSTNASDDDSVAWLITE